MRLALQNGDIKWAKASRRGHQISHLLFVDDYVLFGKATLRRACILGDILKDYERCSGQCVNYNKSTVFFSTNTEDIVRSIISTSMGVRYPNNLEKYLGLPNMIGRKKKRLFKI